MALAQTVKFGYGCVDLMRALWTRDVDTLKGIYKYVFVEIADPRTSNWPLISDPWGVISIVACYLYLIYRFLPQYMEQRKPYDLKGIILGYNIFQVLACSTIIYGIATNGWTTTYTFGCQAVDYSENKMAVRMAWWMWWHFMLKITELLETVIFILRKKFNQASLLHIYHHTTTLACAWIACKYFPGGMITFTVLINSFIHVLMYTYYFLSSCGTPIQKRVEWFKPKLTILQMIQFTIIILHTTQMFMPSCKMAPGIAVAFVPNVIINFYFFIKFYKQAYGKSKRKVL